MLSQAKTYAALALCGLAVGCAHAYQPVVDMKGVDPYRYEQDLAECRRYAEQVSPLQDAGLSALIGAAGGAALGAASGAAFGSPATGAAAGAALGGVGGAGYGGLSGADRQKSIINNCLHGRGYRVLGG